MEKRRGLTGNGLKLIAMLSMLIDHIGSTIVWPLYLNATVVNGVHMMGDSLPERAKQLETLYTLMRTVGRLAFPIFAFMLVEGFIHTRNLKSYMKRLFIFAIISEIPYDLANNKSIVSFSSQNVMWTFLIGLAVLYFIEKVENNVNRRPLTLAFILLGEIATFLIQSDYILGGILFISILYIFRNRYKYIIIGETLLSAFMSLIFSPIQIFAMGAFILLRFYNGRLGKGNKYLFYIFYPAHLSILGLISMAIF